MEPDLKRFIAELNSEVHEQLSDTDGDVNELPSAFTELMMEYLSDNGIVENPSVAAFQGRIGRGIGRIDGYAIGDEETSLTSLLRSSLTPRSPLDFLLKMSDGLWNRLCGTETPRSRGSTTR